MRATLTLWFLLASLGALHGADGWTVSAKVDRKKLELAPDIQTRLVEASAKLLATSSNVFVQPKRTLESARRDSYLDFVFSPPRKFDLGARATGVEVKEMVLTLPVSSGGAWVESTQFRWYCSRFDTNVCADIKRFLSRRPSK
jgi:hypothetical protein